MIREKIISQKGCQIYTRLHCKNHNDQPAILFLHGGAKIDPGENTRDLADFISQNGYPALAFHFSGVGKSSGYLNDQSLHNRMTDIKIVLDNYHFEKPLKIIASSMGAYMAVKMLPLFDVSHVILFCPAAYDCAAYTANFGHDFTQIIRQKKSWQNTDAFKIMQNYSNKVMMITGGRDEVIPAEIFDRYRSAMQHNPSHQFISYPQAPHNIYNYLQDNPDQNAEFKKRLLMFLS